MVDGELSNYMAFKTSMVHPQLQTIWVEFAMGRTERFLQKHQERRSK
jgi:hypothetical protein